MLRLSPILVALPLACVYERPEFVNAEPLPIVAADEKCKGALVSVDAVSLEAPLDGTRRTDDARRALEVALNESGYALTYQSAEAVHMRVNYTAKYKDYGRDRWSDKCCAQLWSICATAHLARQAQIMEDLTVCDENVEVRDVAQLGLERIAAKLVAALAQDVSAKAILSNAAAQPLADDGTMELDE